MSKEPPFPSTGGRRGRCGDRSPRPALIERRRRTPQRRISGRSLDRSDPHRRSGSSSLPTWLAVLTALVFCGVVSAQPGGLVDDFDGHQSAPFSGSYWTFGENNLGQAASSETADQANSGTQSRVLKHTAAGGSSWGMGTRKTFDQPADVQGFDTLELSFFSQSADAVRSFDIALVFQNGTIYSLKPAFEPTLSQSNGQWATLSVPLAVENFDPSWNTANFDLSALAAMEFFVKNNGAGPTDVDVYVDDVMFAGAATVSTPQNLMSFIGDGEVGLAWDGLDGVEGYRVYRRTDDQAPLAGDLLATVDDPSASAFFDTSASDGVVYYYWVTAVAGTVESEFSAPIVAGANFAEFGGSNDRSVLHALEDILGSRARALINALYHAPTGAQASYMTPLGGEPSVLTEYGRVWVYDAGIALSLAVNEGTGSAGARASWMQANSLDVPGQDLFAGWPFSINQERLGDSWRDPRNVTGANSWALYGVAEAIASGGGGDPAFFSRALDGILHHVQPNGLVTAGWTIQGLRNASAYADFTYNEQLSFLGGVQSMDDLNDLIDRLRDDDLLGNLTEMEQRLLAYAEYLSPADFDKVQSLNVVLEHNIDLLDLLNFTLAHYSSLNPSRSYAELNAIRLDLRDAIFSLLYNEEGRHFITGMSDQGVPSPHVAIDNSTWLASALNLEELASHPEMVAKLSDSLDFTIRSFVRRFFIEGQFYYGAHYFLNSFEDAYILNEGQSQNEVYHIEATTGLILGLMDFADAFPDDPNAGYFRREALSLWKDMQRYIHDLGFIYGYQSIQDLFEPLESTVSAVWYLDTLRYFRENPDRYDENPPVITLSPATQDVRVPLGGAYAAPTVTCLDDVGGALPVTVVGAVDTSARGFYTPIYSCVDGNGNKASTPRRAVRVEVYTDPPAGSDDVTAPKIYFTPFADAVSVLRGGTVSYREVGCSDDSDPEPLVSEEPAVDTGLVGLQSRRYYCQDASGNTSSKDFVVLVYGHRRGFWIEDIYGNITGERLWSSNAQTIMTTVSDYESGAQTCTQIVDGLVSQHGLGSPDAYYFECESIQSRRSGELMAAMCPDGIFNDCVLTKDYGQFVSVSGDSLSVDINRGFLWWRFWTGVGATVNANAAVCLNPYHSGSETGCFNGGAPNRDAVFPIIDAVPAPGSSMSDFDLSSVPKLFEYYTWSYKHHERCRDVNNDLCDVDSFDPNPTVDGFTPVLFPPDFDLGAAQAAAGLVAAVNMEEEDCWQNFNVGDPWPNDEECRAGRQRSKPLGGGYIEGVRFFDEYAGWDEEDKDWEWGFYTDN
ncbi:MAG: immunoglobulin-like domain-containing protein, partial [Acidobacteriota bacterium]